ncbi:hypothetical protein BDQ17DRAFT_1480905, partial [Cyathus striatus]
MSLLKVPFLLTLAYAFRFSGLPPPAARRNSESPKVSYGHKYEPIIAYIGPILCNCLWGETILEMCCILWCNWPKHFIQKQIYSQDKICHLNYEVDYMYLMAWMLIVGGALIRRQCYSTLGRMFSFKLTIQEDHQLITTGPYAVVRHPAYGAFLLIELGLIMVRVGKYPVLLNGIPQLSLVAKFYNALYILFSITGVSSLMARVSIEDEMLCKEFGEEWLRWAERVQYKCIPGIY